MPIYSMTGLRGAQARIPLGEQDQLSYTLTVKSGQSSFSGCAVAVAPGLDALEMELRKC